MNELERLLIMLNEAKELYEKIEAKDGFERGALEGIELAECMAKRLKNELEQNK